MNPILKNETNLHSQQHSPSGRGSRRDDKSNTIRKKIITDAREIFSTHLYTKASLRLICNKSGCNHNLIRYHFGSKENLYKIVISQIIDEWTEALPLILRNTGNISPQNDLILFINNFFDYGFEKPDGMRIIAQNIGSRKNDELPDTPGLEVLRAIIKMTEQSVKETLVIRCPEKELLQWIFGFIMTSVWLIGASSSLMLVTGIEDEEKEYIKWVKEFAIASFHPSFRHLITGPNSSEFDDLSVIPTKADVFDTLIEKYEEKSGSQPNTKGEMTREKILSAALNVFSQYPYEEGSIRMIGKEGNLNFKLIRHYFPAKELIFKEVAKKMYHEFIREILFVYEGLDKMKSILKSHNMSSSRLLKHSFKYSKSLALLIQNVARLANLGISLPGFNYILEFVNTIENIIRELENINSTEREIRFLWLFKAVIIINSVGAAGYFAKILNMDPESEEYKQWVYDTYIFLVYPRYRDLLLTGRTFINSSISR